MNRPKICAVIVDRNPDIKKAEPLGDFYEVRIDLIGDGWQQVVKGLNKPWLACNRLVMEGGKCPRDNEGRISLLLEAGDLGASIIDIELSTKSLSKVVPVIKKRAKCLISRHDLQKTPSLKTMKEI